MAARRRYSRGTPDELTITEQREWLELLESDQELQEAVEQLLGARLGDLTGQEKLIAMSRHLKKGKRAQAFNASARAIRETKALAGVIRTEQDLAGDLENAEKRNYELELENRRLREELDRIGGGGGV